MYVSGPGLAPEGGQFPGLTEDYARIAADEYRIIRGPVDAAVAVQGAPHLWSGPHQDLLQQHSQPDITHQRGDPGHRHRGAPAGDAGLRPRHQRRRHLAGDRRRGRCDRARVPGGRFHPGADEAPGHRPGPHRHRQPRDQHLRGAVPAARGSGGEPRPDLRVPGRRPDPAPPRGGGRCHDRRRVGHVHRYGDAAGGGGQAGALRLCRARGFPRCRSSRRPR